MPAKKSSKMAVAQAALKFSDPKDVYGPPGPDGSRKGDLGSGLRMLCAECSGAELVCAATLYVSSLAKAKL